MSARSLIVTTAAILALAGFLAYALFSMGSALVAALLFLGLALIMTKENA